MDIEQLRYPVGKYLPKPDATQEEINTWIDTIEAFPARVTALVAGLTEDQLASQYRPGSWTLRQVVHHVVDSHVNSYIRFKWTLTETDPVIKTYQENLWAEIPDGKSAPIFLSLDFLTALHARWVYMLRRISPENLKRKFFHPEKNKEFDLIWLIGLYAWHCNHHYGHMELAVKSPVMV